LLAEGTLREIQCRTHQIDENDDFGLLLETAGGDVIGAVTVRRLEP
jgi:HipA-like protein